jgi:2'-5' RNA ligase
MSSETIRSFIAFDIEDEEIRRRFSEAQRMLVGTGADLKLVKPQNVHVTMRFLGNITLPLVDAVYEAMRKVSFTPFDIEIRGLGAFPRLQYARVIWAGIRRGKEQLERIFNQLEPQLRRLGFRADPRGFSPHLTIARVKSGRNKAELIHRIRESLDYEFGVVRAECLRLKRSVLTPKGPIYSTLREVCYQNREL